MPISLQADSILPQGYILIDGQKVATISTAGLSADTIFTNDIPNFVPVGSVMTFTASAAPNGWLKLNGAELTRSDFPKLWAFASNSGNIVTDANWISLSAYGSFSQGNSSTTFRIPDLRGEFIRGWSDGRNIGGQSARTFGSFESDAIRNIIGQLGSTVEWVVGSGAFSSTFQRPGLGSGGLGLWDKDFDASRVVPTAADNRPRNVALLYCIKY